jgi:SP family general alpha glucoside:H+ symporter-like MFS transporter
MFQAIIVATVEHEKRTMVTQSTWIAAMKGTDGWRTFISWWPKAMQQLVGQAVFNTYGTYFFQLAGNKDPFTVTSILAICQLIGVLLCALTNDKFGRRQFALGLGGAASAAAMGAGIVGCFNYSSPQLGGLLVFFACVSNFAVIGGAGTAYSYLVEVSSQRLRARTTGIALIGSYLLGIVFAFTTPIMLGANVWAVKAGFFFGCAGTLSCIVGWWCLPELARRTPAELDEMFTKKIGPRKFKKYKTEIQMHLQEQEAMEGRTIQA